MATRRGPDNSIRFSVQGQITPVNWANVFWFSVTMSGTPSVADLDSWTTAMQSGYKGYLAQFLANEVTFTQAQSQLFLPNNGLLTSLVPMTGGGSAGADPVTPQDTCGVISWQINAYWRGGKPRTYLPHLHSSFQQGNDSLTPAAQTLLKTQAESFRDAANGISSGLITATQIGCVSFRSGNAERVPPVFFPIIGEKVHPRLGTQRRRLGPWRA